MINVICRGVSRGSSIIRVFFLKFSDIENMIFFLNFFESVKFTLEKQKIPQKDFPTKKNYWKKKTLGNNEQQWYLK
jgi:hypothetical protein